MTALTATKKERAKIDRLKKQRDTMDKTTKMSEAVAHQPKMTQSTIQSGLNTGAKAAADAAVSRLFYACGISFATADSNCFKEAVDAVAKAGPSYKSPSRAAIIEKHLTLIANWLNTMHK